MSATSDPSVPAMDAMVRSVPMGVRVYATCSQGGRKYMEDTYDVKYQLSTTHSAQQPDLSFIYLAIFDGHGGDMAANYAREHLCHNIIRQRCFWSGEDSGVTQAISKGFLQTHYDMMKEVVHWPKTASGLPSTSGTTASIVFIMNGKYYTGHVGDSRIVLGRKNPSNGKWMSCSLTRDHKPESPREKRRIEAAGGQVMNKSGVDRVVWNRPKLGHKGPIRRSTSFDQIPFLAVARSLGDLWSFNSALNTFIVSPEPDIKCIPIDENDACLLLASDGLWNMMTTQTSIKVMQQIEEDQYGPQLMEEVFGVGSAQMSPSRALVHFCLNRWYQSRFRADNTTVLAVMIDHNREVKLNTNSSYFVNTNGFPFNEDEDESDDGYDEGLDAIDFFSHYIDYNKNNEINVENNYMIDNYCQKLIPSSLPSNTNTSASVPESENITELQKSEVVMSSKSEDFNTKESNQTNETEERIETKVTPIVISESNDTIHSDIGLDNSISASMEEKDSSDIISKEFDENASNESSRDSGTVSPVAITVNDQLTDEEYAALPSLINLSQNQWELFVEIDPKNIHLKSSNLDVLGVCEDTTEVKSSVDNLHKNSVHSTQMNDYIYSKSFSKNDYNNLTNEMRLTPDSYWSEGSNYFTLNSVRPRTSLPLNFGDNHSDSYLHERNERTSASIGDNACIFGALKSCSNNNNNNNNNNTNTNTPFAPKALSQIFKSNNEINKNMSPENHKEKELCLERSNSLLRRMRIDNKPRVTIPPRSATKRKLSPDFSPPSKHLRSSLWTRPLVSREQLMQLSFTKSLKQLAVGRLTRSRLRPIKLLKTFKNNSQMSF